MAKICPGMLAQSCGRIFKPSAATPDPSRCPEHQGHQYLTRRARGRRAGSTSRWRRVRKQILERDGYRCQIGGPGCLGLADTVDHIQAVIDGGTDDPTNLQAACSVCNRQKG